jgi:hypothetical protein
MKRKEEEATKTLALNPCIVRGSSLQTQLLSPMHHKTPLEHKAPTTAGDYALLGATVGIMAALVVALVVAVGVLFQ